jgi:TPR repeat protein
LAELRDNDLFTPPDENYMGECPLCCLPLPIDRAKSTLSSCCSKWICNGCDYANQKREAEAGLEKRCAFCREPLPKSQEEADKNRMERIKKNCPVAMYKFGWKCKDEGDYEAALKYLTKAAELGDIGAHHSLSIMYRDGIGVEKDKKKEVYHAEEAAIGGHHMARHNLGCDEGNNGRFERAKRHFIISANLGYHESLECVKDLYADGLASKEDYANALRAYQAAVDATKSSEREAAERSGLYA